jgi:hypothetical protein
MKKSASLPIDFMKEGGLRFKSPGELFDHLDQISLTQHEQYISEKMLNRHVRWRLKLFHISPEKIEDREGKIVSATSLHLHDELLKRDHKIYCSYMKPDASNLIEQLKRGDSIEVLGRVRQLASMDMKWIVWLDECEMPSEP